MSRDVAVFAAEGVLAGAGVLAVVDPETASIVIIHGSSAGVTVLGAIVAVTVEGAVVEGGEKITRNIFLVRILCGLLTGAACGPWVADQIVAGASTSTKYAVGFMLGFFVWRILQLASTAGKYFLTLDRLKAWVKNKTGIDMDAPTGGGKS